MPNVVQETLRITREQEALRCATIGLRVCEIVELCQIPSRLARRLISEQAFDARPGRPVSVERLLSCGKTNAASRLYLNVLSNTLLRDDAMSSVALLLESYSTFLSLEAGSSALAGPDVYTLMKALNSNRLERYSCVACAKRDWRLRTGKVTTCTPCRDDPIISSEPLGDTYAA